MNQSRHNPYKTYHEFEYISPIRSSDNDWQCQPKPEKVRKTETGKSKKKQNRRTMEWLDENYTKTEGICLPRCILYSHYLDFCSRTNQEPACAATFGKMIRQKFPGITTRRLGTRGHSKYHYYGIGIRETSPYYHAVYSSKGLTRFSSSFSTESKNLQCSKNIGFKFDSGSSSDYPDLSRVIISLSKEFERFQIEELLVKHRGYCNDISQAINQKNFLEMQSMMITFWRSLPQYCYQLLHNEVIIDVICLGDSILNKNLIEILIPISRDAITESALEEMRYVAKHWEEWEMNAMLGLHQIFVKKRLAICHQFAQSVKRQCTFLHLAKTINNILIDSSKVSAMINDISKVDLGSIGSQAFYATTESEGQDSELNAELLKDLKDLLQSHASLERYISWLDSIVEKKVIKPSKQNGRSTKKRAQDFLLKWSFFGARIMHNLTLNNALSFGSFHVLRMLFDEYILFGVETQFNNEKDQELATIVEKNIRKEAKAGTSSFSSHLKDRMSSPESTLSGTSFQLRPSVINQVPSDFSAFSPYPAQVSNMFSEAPSATKTDFPAKQFSPNFVHHPSSFYNHPIYPTTNYTQASLPAIVEGPASMNSVQPASTYISDGDQVFTSLDNFQSDVFQPGAVQQTMIPQQYQQPLHTPVGSYTVDETSPLSSHQCVSVISMASRPQSDNKCLDSLSPSSERTGMMSPLDELANGNKSAMENLQGNFVNTKPSDDATEVIGPYDNYIDTIPITGSLNGSHETTCAGSPGSYGEEFYDSRDAESMGRQINSDTSNFAPNTSCPSWESTFKITDI